MHFTLAGRLAPAAGAALARVAIHLGEVILERQGPGQLTASGLEVERVWRLAALARPGQTLLSSHAFDLARHRSAGEAAPAGALRWLSHGSYRLAADEPPAEIFEVGVEGAAPLLAPESAGILLPAARELVAGWRPAPGVEIPQRPGWVIERKLGKGGFGDVWLTYHALSREARVFKFCYDLERLRSLQREITVFRLLKEHLGTRSDITRVIDWCFDEAPYFVEAEYTPEGSLADWARAQGGLGRISLALRLELMAQVATALAAAHSVGVLHKDVKPANVLIAGGEGGEVRAQLADFGIATVTDLGLLAAAGITALGLTETAASGSQTSPGGTRLYQAPELLEGKVPTLKADIFALGVLLYQMVVGDFSRALGSGWGRDIEDELLREDVAEAVDGSPDRRLGDAAQLAERLRTLPAR
ncbi:MAG TPA: protein kinase, partial [Thermoanaerobaculia bacterium]|nr:protein kinase [Thermoanaerobaculia bacterium]